MASKRRPRLTEIAGAKVTAKAIIKVPALARSNPRWDRLTGRLSRVSALPVEKRPESPPIFEPSKYNDEDE